VSPHHPTRGLGERRKLLQRGRKWILCIFEVRKRPSGTPFSVFLSHGAAGPVKTSPFPHLDGPALELILKLPVNMAVIFSNCYRSDEREKVEN